MTAQDWDLSEDDDPWSFENERGPVRDGAFGKAFACCLSEMIEIEGSHDADCPAQS